MHLINILKPFQKTTIVILHDVLAAAFSFYAAMALRHGVLYEKSIFTNFFWFSLFTATLIQSICFITNGMYKGIWRFSSTPDLVRVIKGATTGIFFSFFAVFLINRLENFPRSMFFIDWMLLVLCLGGSRLAYRLWRDKLSLTPSSQDHKNVIVIGAGSAGEQLYREIRRTPGLKIRIVAFVDDDLGKQKKLLHNVPIMGTISDLPQIIKKTQAKRIFIAIPSASGSQIKKIVDACNNCNEKNLIIKTLPKLADIINGQIQVSSLRNVSVEDLLGRKQIKLDDQSIKSMITNKKVLITGAGGSIGSELSTQIAKFMPSHMILLEISELALYNLEKKLQKSFGYINYTGIIGDVRDNSRISNIIKSFKPDLIFHAAAYKHVPMMEHNYMEAIKTNIFGTDILAKYAVENNVSKFVMVSTDKAVNPTNIMGATKRIAEMICLKYQNSKNSTKFMTVRFGNVLGSSGSVVPLFQEQIENGGPLTITHPDITRYFMSIPEASQLILQAGSIGLGGEIFVLDMGNPIRIVDLAKQMVKLAGLNIDEDIKIKFTGLRPGEKLFEELLVQAESTLPTTHEMVRIAKARPIEDTFYQKIEILSNINPNISASEVKRLLNDIVPEYTPDFQLHPNNKPVEEDIPTLGNYN